MRLSCVRAGVGFTSPISPMAMMLSQNFLQTKRNRVLSMIEDEVRKEISMRSCPHGDSDSARDRNCNENSHFKANILTWDLRI
jgi:hypothetical protein